MNVLSFDDSVSERMHEEPNIEGWSIAPDGYSGRACPSCLRYFTPEEINLMCNMAGSVTGIITCIDCGVKSSPKSAKSAVRNDAIKFFSVETVLETKWYHATIVNNWLHRINTAHSTPLVHLGTYEAAVDRTHSINNYLSDGSSWFIYEVALSPAASVAPHVLDDEDTDAPIDEHNAKLYRRKGYETTGITRYVNRFESEGSISLLANPRVFSKVSKTLLK